MIRGVCLVKVACSVAQRMVIMINRGTGCERRRHEMVDGETEGTTVTKIATEARAMA